MLIIPAERGIDWQRAPVITASIAVLCCAVFFFWQWDDNKRLQAAADLYYNSGLLPLEYENYLSHLYQNQRKREAQRVEQLQKDGDTLSVIVHILIDKSFQEELQHTDQAFWGEDVYYSWHTSRKQINSLMEQVSPFKLGLIPADNRGITYLTYQFMHGDVLHLVGNLVILVLAGIAVEAAIGSFHFLLCYLFCGIVAGLTFTLFNWNSYVPLVGASGAISGVLGMYAALYGMRKIRFFYSVIFYFGYFTAPALVILPVWIAWEVINAVWGQTDAIAYWAHAGGLIAGGVGMLLTRPYLIQVEETYLDNAPDEEEEFRSAMDDYLKQIGNIHFEAAKRKLDELEKNYSDKLPVIEQRYHLEKLTPNTEHFHQVAHGILSQPTTNELKLYLLHEIYRDYTHYQGEHALPDDAFVKLMLGFCQIQEWDTVQTMVKQAQSQRLQYPLLVKLLRLLAKGVAEQGERHQAQQYEELANSLEKSLQPGKS